MSLAVTPQARIAAQLLAIVVNNPDFGEAAAKIADYAVLGRNREGVRTALFAFVDKKLDGQISGMNKAQRDLFVPMTDFIEGLVMEGFLNKLASSQESIDVAKEVNTVAVWYWSLKMNAYNPGLGLTDRACVLAC